MKEDILPKWLNRVQKNLLWLTPALRISISVTLGIKGGSNYHDTPPFVLKKWRAKKSKKEAGAIEINTKEFLLLNFIHADDYKLNTSIFFSPLDIGYLIEMLEIYSKYLNDSKIFVKNNRSETEFSWMTLGNIENYDKDYIYHANRDTVLTFMLSLVSDYESYNTDYDVKIPGLIIRFGEFQQVELTKSKVWGLKEYLKRLDITSVASAMVQTAILSQALDEGKAINIDPEIEEAAIEANIAGMTESEFLDWCRKENLTINLDDFDTLELAKSTAISVYKDREKEIKKD